MAETGPLHDAFVDELRDTYDAERQLTKALAKMAKTATAPELQEAFQSHLEETQGQIQRLEQVFEALEEKVRGKHCDGIAGIIEEGKSIMEEDFDDATIDACLIAAGQRAEHYEMAAYGTLVAWARILGHDEAADLLQQTLDEEKAADEKLSGLAEGGINQSAADASQPEDESDDDGEDTGGRRGGRGDTAGRERRQKERAREAQACDSSSVIVSGGRHGSDPAALADAYSRRSRNQDAMAALGDTRRELAEVFDGLTAYMRSPATGCGQPPMDDKSKTTWSWSKSSPTRSIAHGGAAIPRCWRSDLSRTRFTSGRWIFRCSIRRRHEQAVCDCDRCIIRNRP